MKVRTAYIEQLEKDKPKGKCRKWRLWVRTDTGKKSKVFDGTYTLAQDALELFKTDISGIIPNAETFGQYALAWHSSRARTGSIGANTLSTDLTQVNILVRSPLGKMRMDAIKPSDCRDSLLWIQENPQRPNSTKRGALTNTTMEKTYRICRQIFQQAVDDELLARNPMSKIKDPKNDTQEVEALSWNELLALLDWLDELPLSGYVMCVYMIACSALRRAEACAILNTEVQPTVMRISQAVKERDGSIGKPKSEAGERDLPIMPRLASKITSWRKFRSEKGLADAQTLACNIQGGIIRPQNLYRWWKLTTTGTPYEGIGLHQLRHSNLTHVARSMSAFDLMRYAGWSSLKPTRIYIHDDYESVFRGVCEAWGIEERSLIQLAA